MKTEGASIEYDDMEQNFVNRYVHKVYAKGFIITREMYEDDLYGVVSKRRAKSLARSLRLTKENVVADILNNGFDSNFQMPTGSDGVELLVLPTPQAHTRRTSLTSFRSRLICQRPRLRTW